MYQQINKRTILKKPLFLIGFMGAGKSTVGSILAKKLKASFIDTDTLIELSTNKSPSQIIASEGELIFRRYEYLWLINACLSQRTVISCGGGLPASNHIMNILKYIGTVVFLYITPNQALDRLKNDNSRILLKSEDIRKRILFLLNKRNNIYNLADICIKSKNLPHLTAQEVCKELLIFNKN